MVLYRQTENEKISNNYGKQRLNILFVANRFPFPPFRGDKLKIFNLAKRLSVNNKLFLITFVQDKRDFKYKGELEKYFDKIELVYLPKYLSVLKCGLKLFSKRPYQILYFESSEFRNKLTEFLKTNKIDVIHTQHLRMSQYTYNLKEYKRILDLPDAYSLYWKRRTEMRNSFLIDLFHKIEYRKVLNYEEIIKEFDLNLVCSQEDKDFLIDKHQIDYIDLLANGVDITSFSNEVHDYEISDRLIFTGNMDYFPNIDAVQYFASEIFPQLLEKFPKLKFYIVGQKPVEQVKALQSDNIIVTGFVDDLGKEYDKSTVAVSPIRYGAGTLNKVLEPMAMGIPVVSTEIGFKGLGINSGEGVMLSLNKNEFIENVMKLLSSPELRKQIGEKGRKVIYENYDWNIISKRLETYFKEVMNRK